jgi:ribosomal protein L1
VKAVVGKVDFAPQALEDNITALLQAVAAAKPQGAKLGGGGGGGKGAGYFRAVQLATTMGRGSVPVSLPSVQALTGKSTAKAA